MQHCKKLIPLFVVLCFVIALCVVPSFAEPAPVPGEISADYAFIRAGADRTFASLGGALKGEALEVYSLKDGWYYVKVTATGLMGYVQASAVTVYGSVTQATTASYTMTSFVITTPPPITTTTTTPAPTVQTTTASPYFYGVVNASSLSIRSTPNVPTDGSNNRVGSLTRGTPVIIYEVLEGWYGVFTMTSNPIRGYVSAEYITLGTYDPSNGGVSTEYPVTIPPATTTTTTTVPPATFPVNPDATYARVIADNGLNIRSAPDSSAPIVNRLNYGDILEITLNVGDWVGVISVDGKSGYVATAYLQFGTIDPLTGVFAPDPNQTTAAPPVTQTQSQTQTSATTAPQTTTTPASSTVLVYGAVTATQVNLRSAPALSSQIVGSAQQGDRFLILGREDNWYKIHTGSDFAYISADYVLVDGDNPYGQETFGYVNANSLNLREGPATTYLVLETLNRNDKITILDQNGQWLRVRSPQGKTGYVLATYISFRQTTGTETTATTPAETTLFPPVSGGDKNGGVVLGSYVNLRAQPNTASKVVALLPKGATLEIEGRINNWYHVSLGDLKGYISADYLRPGVPSYSRPISGMIVNPSPEGLLSDLAGLGATAVKNTNLTFGEKVAVVAKSYLGVPYLYGGSSPMTGFDCSGLTTYVFAQLGVTIPRMQQYLAGTDVPKADLMPGDLVFFCSASSTSISHVGIYIGYGKFVHAPSSGNPVMISSLSESYYTRYFVRATRISES